MVYLLHFLKINKKSKLCGKAIIEDLQEAGWSMKKPRENEKISDLDLRHIFDKVDLNQDSYVNRMVMEVNTKISRLCYYFFFSSGNAIGMSLSLQAVWLVLQKSKYHLLKLLVYKLILDSRITKISSWFWCWQ